MHRFFVILDENTNVALAAEQMNLHKAEIIIISRNGAAAGIVTDSSILDEVLMKGEDSVKCALEL
jgi:trk system potassium uptake protein TrkH